MAWDIEWSRTAEKQLSKIDKKNAQKIVRRLDEITDNPYAHVEKLRGNLYKLRVGSYRVIMTLQQQKMIIFVVETGLKSTIYRNY
jgi:mRNA interferase RelE/StbE